MERTGLGVTAWRISASTQAMTRLVVVGIGTLTYPALVAPCIGGITFAYLVLGFSWIYALILLALILGRDQQAGQQLASLAYFIDIPTILCWIIATGSSASPFFLFLALAVAGAALAEPARTTTLLTLIAIAGYSGVLAADGNLANELSSSVLHLGFLGALAAGLTRTKRILLSGAQPQDALKQQEERLLQAHLTDLLEATPDSLLIVDAGSTIVLANHHATDLFGYPTTTLIHKPLQILIPERFRHAHEQHWQGYIARPQARPMGSGLELFALHANGHELPIDVMLSPLDLQDQRFVVCVVRDISQRKQVEALLRQHAQRREIMDTLSQHIAKTQLDYQQVLTTIVHGIANVLRGACVLSLFAAEGQDLVPVASHHPDPATADLLASTLAQLTLAQHDQEHVRRAADPLLLSQPQPRELCAALPAYYEPYLDQVPTSSLLRIPLQVHGSYIGVLELLRDEGAPAYTEADQLFLAELGERAALAVANAQLFAAAQHELQERKQLEQQLVQTQKLELLGRLAGGIAHDFNNLLMIIHSVLHLQRGDLNPASPSADDLALIEATVERGSNLTRQLLAFARKQPYEPRPRDLNALVLHIKPLMDQLIGEHIKLELRLAPGPLTVQADTTQLEQVLINLIVNARDAMPNGGTITIETTTVLRERVYPAPVDDHADTMIQLTVADTGVGMSEEVQQHVFEPFFTTKGPDHGTGLGLATCYGIITQHAGRIEVESVPGQGTCISVYLPQVAQPPQSHPAPAQTSGAEGKGRLLVVEDERMIRTLLERSLRKLGYSVVAVANGEEALTMLQEDKDAPFDLILTDVLMPRLTGLGLLSTLKEASQTYKVILMTGYADDTLVEFLQQHPDVTILQKPFTIGVLTQQIQALLTNLR